MSLLPNASLPTATVGESSDRVAVSTDHNKIKIKLGSNYTINTLYCGSGYERKKLSLANLLEVLGSKVIGNIPRFSHLSKPEIDSLSFSSMVNFMLGRSYIIEMIQNTIYFVSFHYA